MLSVRLAVLAVLLATAPSSVLAQNVPEWLKQAFSTNTPAYDKRVPAVVIFDEQTVTVSENGNVSTTRYYAVRILQREGRDAAAGREVYSPDTGRVRDVKGWLMRPGGSAVSIGKDRVLDVAIADNDVYNEARARVISATDRADVGHVFGYQMTIEDRSVFTQYEWEFQRWLPTLLSRYRLVLPTGWRASSITFNHPNIDPVVSGSSYTWELRNLPPVEREPASPALTDLVPRLAVSYFPGPAARARLGPSFESWKDVSVWLTQLNDPQAAPDENIVAKVRQIIASAGREFDRIQAIGRYVQGIQYISIQTGLGRGGGYRPRTASHVFTKSYGDCKDKATLMRAMLKVIGIESYPVAIYAGDVNYVRPEWPSPQQFNHVIVAISVKDDVDAPSIVNHPSLGRLLLFDPTDEHTALGDIPEEEQGSLALLIAGDRGDLFRVPAISSESNRLERQVDAILRADGSLAATVRERSVGQAAVNERRAFRYLSRTEYAGMIENWITRGAKGASVSEISPNENSSDSSFSLSVKFATSTYGQVMRNQLLIFKPAVVSRRESLFLTEASRRHPVVLYSNAYSETVRVKLPDEFEVDEMPDSVKLETSFGLYNATYEVQDGHLIFTRRLEQKAVRVPAENYDKVRTFFEKIRAAEQSPVVLTRK